MLSLYRRTGHTSPPSAPDAAREIDDRAGVVDFRWRWHELQLAAAQETAFRQEACSGNPIDELAHVAETDASLAVIESPTSTQRRARTGDAHAFLHGDRRPYGVLVQDKLLQLLYAPADLPDPKDGEPRAAGRQRPDDIQ